MGTAVWIRREGRVLLGKRIKGWLAGSWCPPGGGLELFEEPETGALREVQEETGINIKNVRIGTVTDDIFKKEGKHYVTVFVVSEYAFGEIDDNTSVPEGLDKLLEFGEKISDEEIRTKIEEWNKNFDRKLEPSA